MPPSLVTEEWWAETYRWPPQVVRELPLEAYEWFPEIAEARARARDLKAKTSPGAPGAQRRHGRG